MNLKPRIEKIGLPYYRCIAASENAVEIWGSSFAIILFFGDSFMKLLWKLAIPQVCIVVCLGFVSFFIISSSFDSMRDRYVHDIVESRFKRINTDIAAGSQRAVDTSALFAQLPVVAEAYAIALAGDIRDESSPESQQAREKLRRDLAPMLQSYATYAGEKLQLHFHLPNGRSLVRLWRDKQTRRKGEWVDISDDLSSFRPTVMDVNKNGKPVMGIELGSGGIALRGVVPVTGPNGKQLGSVETLQSFAPILAASREEGQNDMVLYINAENLSIATALQDPAKNPRIGSFVRATAPKDKGFEAYVTPQLLEAGKSGSQFENHGALTLATLPINDYRGAQIGVLVCAMRTDAISLVAEKAGLTLILALAGMAIAPFLALLLGLRIWVIRPLEAIKAKMQQIAKGWGELAPAPSSKKTDEIGDLDNLFKTFTTKLDSMLEETAGYVSMLNNVPDPIFMVDENFRILRANQAMADAAGVTEEELKTCHCYDKFKTPVCRTPDCPVQKAKKSHGHVEGGIIELHCNGKTSFIKPSSGELRDASGNTMGFVTVASAVTELVNSERAINEQLKRIKSVNAATREAAEQLAGSAKTLGGQFTDVQHAIASQSDRLEETVQAMEHMNDSVRQVARSAADTAEQSQSARERAEQGASIVEESVQAILRVNEQTAKLKDTMHRLGTQADGIGAVLGVISDIADQTNLLALNAAIEAARAGEAGRGFAVVADEVRKLAEKTMEATGEVEKAISTIQQGAQNSVHMVDETGSMVDRASELAAKSGEALHSIVSLTAASSDQVQGIAKAAEEQSATSEQINRAIDEVAAMGRNVTDRMDTSARTVGELATLAGRLDDLSRNA